VTGGKKPPENRQVDTSSDSAHDQKGSRSAEKRPNRKIPLGNDIPWIAPTAGENTDTIQQEREGLGDSKEKKKVATAAHSKKGKTQREG